MKRVVGPLAVASLVAACGTPAPKPAPAPPLRSEGPEARLVSSNVERRDYAGSASCAPCHSEIYDRWKASPMRRMTQSADAVRAPFDLDGDDGAIQREAAAFVAAAPRITK